MSSNSDFAYIKKNTNVRASSKGATLVKRLIPWLSARYPGYMSRWALRQFTTPPKPHETETQRQWRAKAEVIPLWHEQSRWLDTPQRGGQLLRWGQGERKILLVHGWGGWATQFAAWLPPLLASGCQVLSLDMPGHGEAPKRQVTLFDFMAALRLVERLIGPVDAAAGHSLGASALTLTAAEGWSAGRLVMLAAAENIETAPRQFARMVALPDTIRLNMQEAMAQRHGVSWQELDGRLIVHNARYPALVIHDRQDKEIPYEQGVQLAARWPGAQLVTTEGLGHRRILQDKGVMQQAIDFMLLD